MNPLSSILAHHHLPHRLEPEGPLQSAANASAILMIVLVALLCGAIFLFALNLRRRSLNPSPESLLLAEVDADSKYHPTHRDGHLKQDDSKPRQAWEKSDDWWKSPPSSS